MFIPQIPNYTVQVNKIAIFASKKEMFFLEMSAMVIEEEKTSYNTDLKAMIRAKEEEISKLRDSLQQQDAEIKRSSQVAQGLREELQQVSAELAVKVSQVQDLERSRKELRDDLDRERKRVDHLVMQTTVTGGVNAFHKEIQVSSGIHEWYIAVHLQFVMLSVADV